jgi:hypothetical protein
VLSEVQVMTYPPSSKRVYLGVRNIFRQRRLVCDLCHVFAYLGPDPEGEGA